MALVERVQNSLPQVQRTCAGTYSGWISAFIVPTSLAATEPSLQACPPRGGAREAGRRRLLGAHQRHPIVERERALDQVRERRDDRRVEPLALERVGEQAHRLERLDRLPDPLLDQLRRDALGEQLAGAAVARGGRQRRGDQVAGAGPADERAGVAAARARERED